MDGLCKPVDICSEEFGNGFILKEDDGNITFVCKTGFETPSGLKKHSVRCDPKNQWFLQGKNATDVEHCNVKALCQVKMKYV